MLEGNRRVSASQMLLNPELIPKEFRQDFPSATEDLKRNLKRIPADLAPSRLAAEITITKKHTQPGILRWTPEAQYRRIRRMLESGRQLEDVCSLFGLKSAEVKTRVKEGELLEAARAVPSWSKSEKEILYDPRLRTNSFTRFFTLKGVRKTLGIDYEDDGRLKVDPFQYSTFTKAIEQLARYFLIPDPKTGKPRGNTRSEPKNVFHTLSKGNKALSKLSKSYDKVIQSKAQPKPKPPAPSQPLPNSAATPAPFSIPDFFENLSPKINDPRIVELAAELSEVDRTKFPISSSFLVRALLEACLYWCLKEKSHTSKFRQHCQAKSKPQGLKILIEYCKSNAQELFADPSGARRTLNVWVQSHKDYCDLIVHGNWISPSFSGLQQLAKDTRPFIEKVLDSSVLRV